MKREFKDLIRMESYKNLNSEITGDYDKTHAVKCIKLSKVSDIMKDEYYILAGKNYYENIVTKLKNVKIVMEGLQLGQRLQFLNKELSQ